MLTVAEKSVSPTWIVTVPGLKVKSEMSTVTVSADGTPLAVRGADQVAQIEVPRWSSGRVVLLGDSGQAVSLLGGQGASLGVAVMPRKKPKPPSRKAPPAAANDPEPVRERKAKPAPPQPNRRQRL